jgi:putative Mn2+ efflux pump MntP
MDYITLILLILGLSLDDFAIALAVGLLYSTKSLKNKAIFAFRVAIAFTIPTVFFPFLGWMLGLVLSPLISSLSAWIIFIIFVVIGIWIILDAFEEKEAQKLTSKNLGSFWVLLVLGALTSIDEGAIGITFPFLDIPITIIFITLVIVNILLGVFGVLIGLDSKKIQQKPAEVLAGVLLVCVGLKMLIESILNL